MRLGRIGNRRYTNTKKMLLKDNKQEAEKSKGISQSTVDGKFNAGKRVTFVKVPDDKC